MTAGVCYIDDLQYICVCACCCRACVGDIIRHKKYCIYEIQILSDIGIAAVHVAAVGGAVL